MTYNWIGTFKNSAPKIYISCLITLYTEKLKYTQADFMRQMRDTLVEVLLWPNFHWKGPRNCLTIRLHPNENRLSDWFRSKIYLLDNPINVDRYPRSTTS
jgi:hypothetical protein